LECKLYESKNKIQYNVYSDKSLKGGEKFLTQYKMKTLSECQQFCDEFKGCSGGVFEKKQCWLHFGLDDGDLQPMLVKSKGSTLFRKNLNKKPDEWYFKLPVKDEVSFNDPYDSPRTILRSIYLTFSKSFTIAADAAKCENGGKATEVGEFVSKEYCMSRCVAAPSGTCTNLEYGNEKTNFKCVMWSGVCSTKKIGYSTIYTPGGLDFMLDVLPILAVVVVLCIVLLVLGNLCQILILCKNKASFIKK
jgi:hypothetical protein